MSKGTRDLFSKDLSLGNLKNYGRFFFNQIITQNCAYYVFAGDQFANFEKIRKHLPKTFTNVAKFVNSK